MEKAIEQQIVNGLLNAGKFIAYLIEDTIESTRIIALINELNEVDFNAIVELEDKFNHEICVRAVQGRDPLSIFPTAIYIFKTHGLDFRTIQPDGESQITTR